MPGVADVNALGGFVTTFEVVPDNARLAARGLSLDQLRAANDAALERQRMFFEGEMKKFLAILDSRTKLEAAEIAAGATIDAAQIAAANAATNSEA